MKLESLKSPVLILAVLVAVSGMVVAMFDSSQSDAEPATDSGTCGDNLTWELDGGTLTISGTGAMTEWASASEVPWYSYVSGITAVSIGGGVTTIGAYAFSGTEHVTAIALPSTLTSIGASAFASSGIASLTVPASVKTIGNSAFSGCTGITGLTFSGTSVTLGTYTFKDCSALKTVTMPASLAYGTGAFDGCTIIDTVTIFGNTAMHEYTDGGSTNPYISSPWYVGRANSPTVTISEGVEVIGAYAFAECTFLTSLDSLLPDSMTSIGTYAFKGCTGLTEFTVPSGITLARAAFDGCTSLTTLNIPRDTFVRYTAFSGCDSIDTATITGTGNMLNLSSSSTSSYYCGNAVWNNISGLSVTISDGITSVGSYYFCTGKIGSVVIPQSVTSLGAGAFNSCSSMKSLTIPAAISASGMFSGCSNLETVVLTGSGSTCAYDSETYRHTPWYLSRSTLTKITLNDTITEIGAYIFRGSHPKLSLTVDTQIVAIGEYAFADNRFTSVTIPACTTTISPLAFDGCAGLKTFIVSDTNADYSSVEGLLCNKAGDELVTCPAGITGTFTVPDSITTLRTNSVHGCSSMAAFSIGSGTVLQDNAVSGCSSLKTLYIPADRALLSPGFVCDTLTSVRVTGSGDMYDYSPDPTDDDYFGNTPWYQSRASMASVYISEGITSIGEHAFDGCSFLKRLTIPGSLGLTADSFDNCRELSEVDFIGSGDMFDYSSDESSEYYYKGTPWNVSKAKSLSIILSDTATSVGDNTFRGAITLGNVTFPGTVTSIGAHAFEGCCELTELRFPASVTSIGESAFYGCWSVHKIVFAGRIPADIGSDCFTFKYLDDSETCVVISEDGDDRLPDGSAESGVIQYYTPASYQKYLDDQERIEKLKDLLRTAAIVIPVALILIAAVGITLSERRVV